MANGRNWKTIDNDKEKYAAYLCSREWGVLKEKVRERACGICERCSALPMDACHHLTYERKYSEQLNDLQAICTRCHEFTHGKKDFDPLVNSGFLRWLSIQKQLPSWLTATWGETWLDQIRTDTSLLIAMQAWVSTCIACGGITQAVEAYRDFKGPDGYTVEECGEMPSNYELTIYKGLDQDQLGLMSWLNWGGPLPHPLSDGGVFRECVTIAESIRKPPG